ncbi:MAG: hypothetical protein Q9157_006479 [Trypethelium eluteriae]
MSTILRTLRNLRKIGFKEYGHQMQVREAHVFSTSLAWSLPYSPGPAASIWVIPKLVPSLQKIDTVTNTSRTSKKSSHVSRVSSIPTLEVLRNPSTVRTRWVDYHDKEFDPSQIEPGWHAWMSYMVDKPPSADPINQTRVREWEPKEHRPTLTWSRSAYRPYSTTKNKYSAWVPEAKPRV